MSLNRNQFIQALSMASLTMWLSEPNDSEQATLDTKPPIKPKALKKNSKIGLVSPASPVYDPKDFDEMLKKVDSLGYDWVLGNHAKDRRGYLAGTDKDRAEDLMDMFKNPEIDAILCIRGGWGCNRILPHMDFDVIRNHPKILCGFSDITSLHLSIWKKCNMHTFHGPVGTSSWNNYTEQNFRDVISKGEQVVYLPEKNEQNEYTHTIISMGTTDGILLGGNLTVLCSLLGTEFMPDFKGAILYLEDVGEDIYRVDRMLTQLKLSGILNDITGFVFGKCTNCDAGSNSLSLEQVFDDHIKPLGIPAFYGALISHEADNSTIPVGIHARMDAQKGSIELLERPVRI